MRPRTRFWLDIVLAIALIAAWRPSWTGISLHQWLSIAVIAPLLLHTVVNWDWAVRILRTFVERLLHASRLNLVVDLALFVATVACMASGFMVSPGLLALLGIHVATSIEWHLIHLWSANAVIALLAVHGALHWRWLANTAKRLAENPAPPRLARARAARPATAAARELTLAAGLIEIPGEPVPAPPRAAPARRSRVGSRAEQAAKERASAIRLASLLGVTAALVLAVFVAEGIASPLFPAAPASAVASAGQQTCPATGCTASTCHGTTHADPYTFYGMKRAAKKSPRTAARRNVASAKRAAAKRVTPAASSAGKTVASAAKKSVAASAAKKTASTAARKVAKSATPAAKKPTAKKKTTLMTCPSTGCTASSCHGAHHQSASSYYN